MVAAFDYCLHGRGGAAPSIDTAMHGLVDAAHVDHLHPDSGIALATAADGEALTRAVLRRPGRLGRLAPAGVPARARHRRDPARAARGDRGDPRRPRDHRLGRHVGRVRGALARDHPDGRAVHRRARPAPTRSGRRSPATSRSPRRSATPGRRPSCRWSAGSPRPIGRRSATTPTARSCSTSSAGPSIRGWPRSERRAPTTSCGPRSGRWSSTCPPTRRLGRRRRPAARAARGLPRRLPGLLRAPRRRRTARRCAAPTRRSCSSPASACSRSGPNKQTARVAGEFYVNAINVMRGAEAALHATPRSPSRRSSGSSTGRSRRPSSQRMPKPEAARRAGRARHRRRLGDRQGDRPAAGRRGRVRRRRRHRRRQRGDRRPRARRTGHARSASSPT